MACQASSVCQRAQRSAHLSLPAHSPGLWQCPAPAPAQDLDDSTGGASSQGLFAQGSHGGSPGCLRGVTGHVRSPAGHTLAHQKPLRALRGSDFKPRDIDFALRAMVMATVG